MFNKENKLEKQQTTYTYTATATRTTQQTGVKKYKRNTKNK